MTSNIALMMSQKNEWFGSSKVDKTIKNRNGSPNDDAKEPLLGQDDIFP